MPALRDVAGGTFHAQHYSPGNNQLMGTWEVRWNAIPPTLVRTCNSSDDPDLVGKTWEVKITQLNDEGLAYQFPDQFPHGDTVRYTRVSASDLAQQELEEMQGTWVPLHYEAKGQMVPVNFRQIIQGDKVTFYVNGDVTFPGQAFDDVGVSLQPFFLGLFAIEFRVSRPVSLILQLRGDTRPFHDTIAILDKRILETDLGVNWAISRHLVLQAGLTEDQFNSACCSADVSFFLNLTGRF
jgi:hypothetical protein